SEERRVGKECRFGGMLATWNYANVAEHVEPYIKKMSYSGSEVDPGLYIIPNYNRFYGDIVGGTYYGPAFWIQKRVLEDAGYPELENMTLERYFFFHAEDGIRDFHVTGVQTCALPI